MQPPIGIACCEEVKALQLSISRTLSDDYVM